MVESKEGPISFTLHLDGREEAVKVMEPEMDVPMPEDGRLVVKERGSVWCDLKFIFNPGSDRPYELYCTVMMGISYAPPGHLIAFGTPVAEDRDLLNRYKIEILARGSLMAWIEMTGGKARLFIKFEGELQ